jgi:hypothetical protein
MLHELPREILVLISDFLDQIQPSSVINLACVNSNFLSICTPLLQVRTLKFSVYDDGEQLAEDILHYSELLQRLGGFRAVRRVIIVTSDDKKVISEDMQQRRSQQQWQRPKISTLDYRGHEYDVLRNNTQKPGLPKYKDTAHQKNRLWIPLADFILRLPLLDSIFYSSYYQVPPCILDSILQSRPQCRLYITRFALWSLGPQGITDPYELELIASPLLHGIGTASTSIYGYTNQDPAPREHIYLDQALRHLVSDLTPQLKNLVMIQLQPFRQYSAINNGPLLSMGFTPQANRQTSGLLENLEIRDNTYPGRLHRKEDMEIWNQDIDLSVLRTLKIGPKSTLEAVEYMTKTCSFLSLTCLSINFNPERNLWHGSDYYTTASLFLVSIPALSELELYGWHPELDTKSILKHHGPRLRRLLLLAREGENISLETLNHLGENCPLLEDLTTQIRRSRGDFQEVVKYRAIGRIPRLKRLFLKLDVSDLFLLHGTSKDLGIDGDNDDDDDDDFDNDYDNDEEYKPTRSTLEVRNDPSFNSFDQQYCRSRIFHCHLRPRKGHIRDAFINAALDQELARRIFQTICSDTSGEETCPLQYLEVQAMGAGQLSWNNQSFQRGFHDVLSRLGRTHCVTRNGNEDFKIEVGVTAQVFTSHPIHPYFDNQETPQILPFALKIYRRLWPPKNEHWFDDWHSFPLALSTENEIDWAKS